MKKGGGDRFRLRSILFLNFVNAAEVGGEYAARCAVFRADREVRAVVAILVIDDRKVVSDHYSAERTDLHALFAAYAAA